MIPCQSLIFPDLIFLGVVQGRSLGKNNFSESFYKRIYLLVKLQVEVCLKNLGTVIQMWKLRHADAHIKTEFFKLCILNPYSFRVV